MRIDPSETYPHVRGYNSDAKHPNGDLDRITLTGDGAVCWTVRGEPIVWILDRAARLDGNSPLWDRFYWVNDHSTKHDRSFRRYDFSRSLLSSQVNDIHYRIMSIYGHMLTGSNIEPRVRTVSEIEPDGFLTDYEDMKVDLESDCRTAAFDKVNYGSVAHRDLIKAMHDDMAELDGMFLYAYSNDSPSGAERSLISFNVYKTTSGGQLPFASEPINISGDSYKDIHSGGYVSAFNYEKFKGKTFDGQDVEGVNYIVPPSGIDAIAITPRDGNVTSAIAILMLDVSSSNPPYFGRVWYPVRMRKEFDDLYTLGSDALRDPDILLSSINLIGSSTDVHPDEHGYYQYRASMTIVGVDFLLALKKEST